MKTLIFGMRFVANLSTLLNDISKLTERYQHIINKFMFQTIYISLNLLLSVLFLRKDYRFDAVECQNPLEFVVDQWKIVFSTENSAKWILINIPPLYNQSQIIPTFDEYKQHVLNKTLNYATELEVSKVHLVTNDVIDSSQM
ncbi:unnamed protein product [Didymodactylos carnosus]|uniref:Uncharacterized protein n=1 Tax=Didymodactylos carnosus TaxID=1234261 RepID=A0A813P9H7_9BILA|nr:unnamed protein product [Didymodactylos carnosus]CAF3529587.1 unnamed protein product [Didymodactylos carnosus]